MSEAVMTHLPPLSELDTSNPPKGNAQPCFVCSAQATVSNGATTVTVNTGEITDTKGRAWCLNCARKALSMLVFKKEHNKDRNERCACGSGKKYKYCCMNK